MSGVRDFEASADGSAIIAHRVVPEGVEELEISLPAVISVAAVDTEKNAPTMKEMLAARKAPITKVDLASADNGRMRVAAVRTPAPHLAKTFDGSVDQAAEQLVAALRADGVL